MADALVAGMTKEQLSELTRAIASAVDGASPPAKAQANERALAKDVVSPQPYARAHLDASGAEDLAKTNVTEVVVKCPIDERREEISKLSCLNDMRIMNAQNEMINLLVSPLTGQKSGKACFNELTPQGDIFKAQKEMWIFVVASLERANILVQEALPTHSLSLTAIWDT